MPKHWQAWRPSRLPPQPLTSEGMSSQGHDLWTSTEAKTIGDDCQHDHLYPVYVMFCFDFAFDVAIDLDLRLMLVLDDANDDDLVDLILVSVFVLVLASE